MYGGLRNKANSVICADTTCTYTTPLCETHYDIAIYSMPLVAYFTNTGLLLRVPGGGSNRDLFLGIMTMERMEAK